MDILKAYERPSKRRRSWRLREALFKRQVMKACRYAKRNGFKSRRMTRNDRYWYERCNRPTCGNKPRVWIHGSLPGM